VPCRFSKCEPESPLSSVCCRDKNLLSVWKTEGIISNLLLLTRLLTRLKVTQNLVFGGGPSRARKGKSAGGPFRINRVKGVRNYRPSAMLPEQIVKRLDTECLQRRVSVEGQLAKGPEAGSVHPDQHATQITLDRRWIDLSCPSRGR
jgi:hypothetical protein